MNAGSDRQGSAAVITRDDAISILKPYLGKDLRPIAEERGVTVWKNGRKNKGWAGMVVERLLGHRQDAAQAPDFGTWELKVVPIVRNAQGHWQVKETMAITMIDPKNVAETPFEHSHLLDKLRALLVCAREWTNDRDERSRLLKIGTFDLADGETFRKVHQLIDELPEECRSLIRGAYFEGLTLTEAGQRLGIGKAWASRLHAKALQRLGRSLRLAGIGD